MKLYALGGYMHCSLSSKQLSHCSSRSVRQVLVLHVSSSVDQQSCSFDLCYQVSNDELQSLELGQSLAKLLSCLHVLDGYVQSALSDTQSLGSDTDTAAVQCGHSYLEALSYFTQKSVLRNLAVLEDQLCCGGCADTHLVLSLTDGEALVALFNDEGADSVVALGLVSHSHDYEYIGISAVCDEYLSAIQQPVVSAVLCSCLLSGSVCAGTRLCQTESTQLLSG